LAYFSNRSGSLQLWAIREDGSGNEQLTGGTQAGFGEWSPDGLRFAVNGIVDANIGRRVIIFDPSRAWDEQEVSILPVPDSSIGQFNVNDWSPDGLRLAGMNGVQDTGILTYDLASGTYERLTDFGQWPVWLADNRHLLFVSGGSAFYVIDSRSKEVREVLSVTRDVLGPPRVTRDGREVVFTRRVTEGDVWLVTLR
jgi:Tol biopolymer transport system component